MRIAIIGAGNVGGGLGAALAKAGHAIVFGVRDPDSEKCQAALRGASGSTATTPGEAVDGADIVAFTLRWRWVEETIRQMPPLAGRTVVDVMNRFDGDPGRSTSQDLADLLPGARIVKAFNTIGFENLATAHDRTVPAAMFVAGDDEEAKRRVMDLAAQLGFRPEDAGPLTNAKPLEEMVRVWLALTRQHGRGVGFAISEG